MSDSASGLHDQDLVSVQQARDFVERADAAASRFKEFNQQQVDKIVAAMAAAARQASRRLAELAVEETGRGKVADKVIKNLFSAVDVYNYVKDLKTCDVLSEDTEKQIIEIGVPFGVIAVVVPTTNPTSTAIFKLLSALKGRNTVVVAPHPQAVRCTIETCSAMAKAAIRAGAPQDSILCMDQVTLEGTTELMRHRKTRLILATGGSAMVRAAYSSGKPAYGVGPGNVPAFVERTADVPKAIRDILAGKTFDYGLLCSSEQALICDLPVKEQALDELRKRKAYLLSESEQQRLEGLVQTAAGRLNPEIAGKSSQTIAEMAGFSVPDDTVCLVGFPKGVGKSHPLSREKLSPILAFYSADGWEDACRRCIEILSFGGLGHTMSIHSTDRRIIMEFGLKKPAYRICVNTPSTHGSVGLTTGVPPSMTLGCGSPGGNITSDNITPLHLINIRRLAFETRSVDQIDFAPSDQFAPSAPAVDLPLRRLVSNVVEDYLAQKKRGAFDKGLDQPSATVLPLPSPRAVAPVPAGPAVDFVCEEDVRQALDSGQKIPVNARTIITPSARDLAQDKNLFIWR